MNAALPLAHGWRSSSFRCHWTSAFPSGHQIATKTSSQNAAAAGSAAASAYVVETVPLPVTAFVVARTVPGTTRWHANENLTALPDFRPVRSCSRLNRPGSYLQHSPRHRHFNHPADSPEIRHAVADRATAKEFLAPGTGSRIRPPKSFPG